ncbi:hypothetical protein [Dactylosporangium salmoneum]|uniref:Uncharacterized protein n=1 Tax=Dactylosporangium salmoneum TaxID=53361 RepID=A0ABN3H0J9_9ACTN
MTGVGTAAVAGLYLVGGSSRIPLVATMLHETLGIAPVVAEQPELVVAEGSLYVNRMAGAATSTAAVPAAAPVSAVPDYPRTQAFSAAPVSSPAYAPLPVSLAAPPVSPPVGPPSPPAGMPSFGPPSPSAGMPPVYPQQSVTGPIPQGRRGTSPALLAALIVVGLLVVGGGVYGATRLFNKDTGGPSSSASGGAGGGVPATKGGAGKYDLAKLPEDLCTVSDPTSLYDLFEAENAKPFAQRVPQSVVNSASCTFMRLHDANKPTLQTGTISFQAFAYNDASVAATQHNSDIDTAKLAGPNGPVPGLGEDAIIYETPPVNADLKGTVHLTLALKDSNVIYKLDFNGQRNDGGEWSQKSKNDIRDRMITAVKNSLPKTLAGMAR